MAYVHHWYLQITSSLQNNDTPLGSTTNIWDIIWNEEDSTEKSIKLHLKATYFSLPVRLGLYTLPGRLLALRLWGGKLNKDYGEKSRICLPELELVLTSALFVNQQTQGLYNNVWWLWCCKFFLLQPGLRHFIHPNAA